MYLKLNKKISPLVVAKMLDPRLTEEKINYDYENVYEWAYIKVPGFNYTLNVSRDHGQSETDDDILDAMTDEQILNLPQAGMTYITCEHSEELPIDLIKYIAEKTKSQLNVYLHRLNIDTDDGVPAYQI